MIDISAGIGAALQQISGITVYYFEPTEWTSLPAVSYFEVKNVEYAQADGQEYLSDIVYQIDVFADSRSEDRANGNRSGRLALSARGFKRESGADTVDSGTGLYHRTMQYGCIADQNEHIFQKNNQ